MAARRPLVLVNGRLKELPVGDTSVGAVAELELAKYLVDSNGARIIGSNGLPLRTTGYTLADLVPGDAVTPWTLSSLSTPPKIWADMEASLALVTTAHAASMTPTAVASLFNAGTYTGTTGNAVLQNFNPRFNNRRTMYFTGSASRLSFAGAGAVLQNKTGATLITFMRYLDEMGAQQTDRCFVYVGTASAGSSRCLINTGSTVVNSLRYGGRRLDADTFDGFSMTETIGTGPTLVIAEFDYTSAVKRLYVNGTLIDTDSAFQTAGSTSNTASDAVVFGGSDAGGSFAAKHEFHCGGIADVVYSTADRQKIEGYLMHRVGMPELLPSTHPYRTFAP